MTKYILYSLFWVKLEEKKLNKKNIVTINNSVSWVLKKVVERLN
jgi:hypothetical protein